MAEIDKSIKLVFNEFQRSISEVPLEVYYQTITSDQYSQSGYQFNIKQPGAHALLDTDVWIEYNIRIRETADFAIQRSYEANAATAGSVLFPANNTKIALRSGYVMQRATANFSLQINNMTLNLRPHLHTDLFNRMYLSNDQAEHEFSTSGGRFEEGNHGHRTSNVQIRNPINSGNDIVNTNEYSPQKADGAFVTNAQNADGNIHFRTFYMKGWKVPPGLGTANNFNTYLWDPYPMKYEFMNPGFESRVNKFARTARSNLTFGDTGGTGSAAAGGAQFVGTIAAGNQRFYEFRLFERLPIPLFKMYSNDEVFGVIPNVVQMQIQGNFDSNLDQLIMRSNTSVPNVSTYWTGITQEHCKLYLRWYTPPTSMAIPREISIPFKKIFNWSKNITITNTSGAGGANYLEQNVSEYNVTLESIPDLLCIYMKYRTANMTFDTPDDYNLEIRDFSINIDNASGKVNQIQSLDLYNKWKKLLKHSDNKIIGYDEWRRYCCVACLQPEDYGVRYGPGYSNMTVLGLSFTARNWHINPSIGWGLLAQDEGGQEFLGGAAGVGQLADLVITAVYYKNRVILRADGSASQDLMKVAADFDMRQPAGMNLESGGQGQLNA